MKRKPTARLTTEEVVEVFKKTHGNRYDYSRVEYTGYAVKVIIGCSDHGWFKQDVSCHKRGNGCTECGKISKASKHTMDHDSIISKFKEVHGEKYDYSRVIYVKGRQKVIIGCPTHGWFQQTPLLHKSGSGCLKCSFINGGNLRKIDCDEIIASFRKAHGNKYDYSRVEYNGVQQKVTIGCPIHGWFEQIPKSHKKGFGCTKCGLEITSKSNTITKKEFVSRSKKHHGNKFDYSLVDVNQFVNKGKVKIICPIHGLFLQRHDHHMAGIECNKCANEKNGQRKRLTNKQFIDKAKSIHGNKYNYSKTYYSRINECVTIICQTHGEFSQKPKSHLAGNGCQKCRQSGGERVVGLWLQSQSIAYEPEKWFRDCISTTTGYPLKFDFYLPTYNIIIEFDGKQHYEPIEFFGGNDRFEIAKAYDKTKNRYAKKKGIPLLRIPFFSIKNVPDILAKFLADHS